MAALGLLIGVCLMPVLIFYAGAATLGRFEGASLGRLYHSLLVGLGRGLNRLLGGAPGPIRALFAPSGPEGLVARRRTLNLIRIQVPCAADAN